MTVRTRRDLRWTYFVLPVAVAVLWLLPVTASQDLAVEPQGEVCECEGCTSVLVGKAASVDGSTMTSHSCDSNTDRTWMSLEPNRKHKPGAMAKVYLDPKRTKGPDDPDGASRPTATGPPRSPPASGNCRQARPARIARPDHPPTVDAGIDIRGWQEAVHALAKCS